MRFCLTVSVFAFLAACAQTPVVQPIPSTVPEAVVGQWGGRFAVKVDRVSLAETQSTQQDSAQGGFNLESTLAGSVLELNSPLGQTIALIRTVPGLATLSLGDNKQFQAASAQELLEGQLGWRLPIDRLPRALAALGSEAVQLDNKATVIAQALGSDWVAQLTELGGGRSRLILTWQGLSQNVTKLVLTLIIERQVGVSTNLRR